MPVLVVNEDRKRGRVYYEAFWRDRGRQIKKRIGPAWLELTADDGWRPRRGRAADGYYDEHRAHLRAAELVAEYEAGVERAKQDGPTFRTVALAWLARLERRGMKPSTLRDHRNLLADHGRIMRALGDRPAAEVTVAEVQALLDDIAGPRTANKHRAVVSAVFNHGVRSLGLPANPARATDKRQEPQQELDTYSAAEVEQLAEALAEGKHRDRARPAVSAEEVASRAAEDQQDAELVGVAAYCGLRQGELLALRWSDVGDDVLTVSRALSAGVESGTKGGRVRHVPLVPQAREALDRLRERGDFTSPSDYVFANWQGQRIDDSALRKRYRRAQKAAGLRPLRFHDLRHTYGSLLAAGGVDVVAIQSAMGHSHITTTSRYLHARQASEQVERFARALGG